MHQKGHYGLALLAYAPVAYYLLSRGEYALALSGAVILPGTASLPDIDQRLPLIKHRGITHTIWFAGLTGVATGALGYGGATVVDLPLFSFTPLQVGLVTGTTGFLTILSHLLGDIITPAGLCPLSPLWQKKVSLNLVLAKNFVANSVLLILGMLAFGGAVTLATSNIPI